MTSLLKIFISDSRADSPYMMTEATMRQKDFSVDYDMRTEIGRFVSAAYLLF